MMRHEEQLKIGAITTLDEPVAETIMRDLQQVADKLKVVLMPLGKESQSNVIQKLRECACVCASDRAFAHVF